jgi:RHS repeat-associated protein
VDGVPTSYVWDREASLPQLADDGTNAYLHADGMVAQIDDADEATYLLEDGLGSVRALADDGGTLAGTADYDVFGEVRASSGASSVFGFTGEQFDSETGFTFLRARYLDPRLGRFLSMDSVQPNAPGTQGYNPFAYVANNPTTWVDPSGHHIGGSSNAYGWVPLHIIAAVIACANATTIGLGPCVLAIVTPILVCALDPECRKWAMEFAKEIIERGSDSGEGDTDWGPDELDDAGQGFPEEPEAESPRESSEWDFLGCVLDCLCPQDDLLGNASCWGVRLSFAAACGMLCAECDALRPEPGPIKKWGICGACATCALKISEGAFDCVQKCQGR